MVAATARTGAVAGTGRPRRTPAADPPARRWPSGRVSGASRGGLPLRTLQPRDQLGQDAPHRLLVHPHQHRVLERVAHGLGKFGVVFREHLQLVAAGDRRAVGLRPDRRGGVPGGRVLRDRGGHFGAPCVAGFTASPGFTVLTMVVTLKMNFPSSCSRLTEDWVMVIVPPGSSIVLSPPGVSDRNLTPSRPSLVTSALLSLGSCSLSCTVSVTTAR